MRPSGVALATFPPSILVYVHRLIKRKDTMRAAKHTMAIYWRRAETLSENADMYENPKNFVFQCDDYLIEASAVRLGDHWYPEYQISKLGVIIEPKQRPACFGLEEHGLAVLEAFQYAIADINPRKTKGTW